MAAGKENPTPYSHDELTVKYQHHASLIKLMSLWMQR
jgi:hypothetical protein